MKENIITWCQRVRLSRRSSNKSPTASAAALTYGFYHWPRTKHVFNSPLAWENIFSSWRTCAERFAFHFSTETSALGVTALTGRISADQHQSAGKPEESICSGSFHLHDLDRLSLGFRTDRGPFSLGFCAHMPHIPANGSDGRLSGPHYATGRCLWEKARVVSAVACSDKLWDRWRPSWAALGWSSPQGNTAPL